MVRSLNVSRFRQSNTLTPSSSLASDLAASILLLLHWEIYKTLPLLTLALCCNAAQTVAIFTCKRLCHLSIDLCLCLLSSLVRLWVAAHLAVDAHFGTMLIDCFPRRIFPSARIAVSRKPQSVAIQVYTISSNKNKLFETVSCKPDDNADEALFYNILCKDIWVTIEKVPQLYTKQQVLISTRLHGLLSLEMRSMLIGCHVNCLITVLFCTMYYTYDCMTSKNFFKILNENESTVEEKREAS